MCWQLENSNSWWDMRKRKRAQKNFLKALSHRLWAIFGHQLSKSSWWKKSSKSNIFIWAKFWAKSLLKSDDWWMDNYLFSFKHLGFYLLLRPDSKASYFEGLCLFSRAVLIHQSHVHFRSRFTSQAVCSIFIARFFFSFFQWASDCLHQCHLLSSNGPWDV